MGDEGSGFDPCECLWGHEIAMRRLLNVLRNSQALCTDSECIVDDVPRHSSPDQILLMGIFLVTAFFLYYFRPRPQAVEGPTKSSNRGNSGPPPTPPPATN